MDNLDIKANSFEDENFNHSPADDDVFELKSMALPKEFRKSLSDFVDKRYLAVLFSSFLVHFLLVVYFLLNPVSEAHKLDKIARIQERLVKTLKEREVKIDESLAKFEFLKVKPKNAEAEQKEGGGKTASEAASKKSSAKKSSSKKASTGNKRRLARNARRGGSGKRGSSKAAIEATMSSKGILGLLTSTSNVSTGREVADILGKSNQTRRDLDKALMNLSGITTSGVVGKGGQGYGYSNANVKGGRFGDNSDIDDLVSGLGKTKSNSIKRSGNLVVVSESPLVESSSRKGIVGRNQDDVQAIVVKHNSSIQYCYERELKRNPNLKGKLVIRFTITPRGTIKNVEIVSSTLNNRKVEQCVISRIRRWTDFGAIAASYGDTTIRQVYAFGY